MKNVADNLPVVGNDAKSLGVRIGPDLTVDVTTGLVALDGKGMSVVPDWRHLVYYRIPRRLRHLVPGAAGSDVTFCFVLGSGPFTAGNVTSDLELIPDAGPPPIVHGVVAPNRVMPTQNYLDALAATRSDWVIDET